jgi:hypothetical protein
VADEQNRFPGVVQLAFEPTFARHVEEVVWFVEDEDVELAPQQRFECESFLLPATECPQLASPHLVEVLTERSCDIFAPGDFKVVSPGVAPRGKGVGVCHWIVSEVRFGQLQSDRGILKTAGRE